MMKIYDWLGIHTIESITAALDKMVARLKSYEQKLSDEAHDKRIEATKLLADAEDAAAEALRANSTAAKIAALLT